MRWIVAPLVLIAALLCAAGALLSVVDQNRMIRTFVPVKATVTSTDMKVHHGKHTSYTPIVDYRYAVDNTPYVSSRIFPYEEDGDYGWAQGVIDHFPVGETTAFIDPQAPGDSILLKEYSVSPYGLCAVALFFVVGALAFLVGAAGGARSAMLGVPVGEDGWTLLLPQLSLRKGRRNAAFFWLMVTLTFVPLFAHFMMVVEHYGFGGWFWVVLVAALWIIFSIWMVRRWMISRDVSDARVEIRPAPMQLGSPLEIRVELDAYRELRVKGLVAHIICTENYKEKRGNKTYYGSRAKGKKTITLIPDAVEKIIQSHEVIRGEGEVLFEAGEWPMSWDGGVKNYPYCTWNVRVELSLVGTVDYKATFPIGVEALALSNPQA